MPYSFRNKCDIFNIMEYLSVNDLGRAIAAYKFYDLSNSYNAAEFSFKESQKQTDIYKKFYFLKEAIIGFNSCYDFPLQIIYFAFDFFDKINSAEDYKKAIKNGCKTYEWGKNTNGDREYQKTIFLEDLEHLKKTNCNAKDFFKEFDKYTNFASDPDYGIRQWANNIKHQGGFVVSDILEKDEVAYIQCLHNNEVTFTTEWLYPYTPSFDEMSNRIERQKNNLHQFMDWLCDSIFGDTQRIDFKPKQKLFSANKCTQEIKYSMIVPIQHNKTKE